MKPKKLCLLIFVVVLVLTACGPNPQQIAQTTADTQAAASPLPLPSDTPQPTNTPTSTIPPTETPVPTSTKTATRTMRPSNTPTITPTPGPFSFYDDFTADTGGWENCEGCVWKEGTLVMGPYDPSSFFHQNYCTACDERTFYRMSVDMTFIDGQVDRFFGVVFADGEHEMYYLGVSPWGFYYIARWHWEENYWDRIALTQSGAVKGGYETNHIVIEVKPAAKEGFTDIYIYLNDNLINVLYTLENEPTWVGLAMDYHGQVAAYDNWEYVEIEE